MTSSISAILDRAADLIEPEGAWTQGALARNASKAVTPPNRKDAVCWCVEGALVRLGASEDVWNFLKAFLGVAILEDWNDAPDRTQSEVVAKLREAAANARESGL